MSRGADLAGAGEARFPVADRTQVRRAAWRLVRPERGAFAAITGLYCLAAVAGLAAPLLIGVIVDELRAGAGVGTVDRLALLICLLLVVRLFLERFARYAGHRFGERALARLREEFLDRVLRLPLATVERAGTGDLMTRSTADVATVAPVVRDAAPEIFFALVQIGFILGALFVLHPLLGLVALAGMPVLLPSLRWYLRRARPAYLGEGAADTEISEELAATVDGGRTVEAYGMADERIRLGDRTVADGVDSRRRTLRLRTVFYSGLELAFSLPTVAMLLVGGGFHLAGAMSLGTVVAGVLFAQRLVGPLTSILLWVDQLQLGAAAFARIHGVAATDDRQVTDEVPVDDRVAVVDVHYAYREGHDVLRGVDLTVTSGERLAVVGPSGAGKSTLGRLLAGIDPPRRGRVEIGGVPTSRLPLSELRQRVVLVTQEHHIFLGPLRDNLALAAPGADDAALRAALAVVDADWAQHLPDGLDTALGAGGLELDPGQAQQVALARLILADPHTVILDEATSQLDPSSARRTERALAAALAGRTVVAIAHRLQAAHDADRVAVVSDGRIIELGSHEELMARGGSYARLWRAWRGNRERGLTRGNRSASRDGPARLPVVRIFRAD